ncbi:drug resistance transporter, EmrB/QacA subfamily [Thermosyntropha lipolytica DSM 11003]|uniref:Drug resistance transporter, EmrB/QacA subfamily n=1 Tax=Thermosyntropha lipolytica DSM 11003 TaxID=1123382 RepID=A0A1M5KSP9_9FIRM|nr:MFS transporter [Thermosyntropha lipolytica]SHG55775.1 drug resistance transporter, EmrB/QacA subfamily [Thermosyntropha lipolytica DSM 11003]
MRLAYKWQVLSIVNIGIFMSTLDGSILNIANPTIAKSLSVSLSQIQWLVTSYMLVITATLLFFGKLSDQVGRHKIYAYGFLIFASGSLLCSLSRSLLFLIGARIIQAIGASMMMATGMAIVSTAFPANERGKALGFTASMVGIGNMTGPSLGGILVANFPWPVIFLINVPIGLIGFYLAQKFFLPAKINNNRQKPDIGGTIILSLSLVLFLLALSPEAEKRSLFLIISLFLFFLFILLERKISNPLLDFELFYNKNFVFGNLMAMLAYTTQTSVIFMLPFYFENILYLSPAYSGFLMTIPPIIMALTAPIAGNLSDRIGAMPLTSISFGMLSAAHTVFAFSILNRNLSLTIIGLIILGIGMGSFGSPNNSSILGSVPPEKSGYTGGFISTVRNFSFSLGIASSVSIFVFIFNHLPSSLTYNLAYAKALHYVYMISAAINLLGLGTSILTRQYRSTSSTSMQNSSIS